MPSSPPSADPAGVVLTFLESVGRRSDAEFYLRLFRELPKESFAVIAAEASVVEHARGAVAQQMRFLHDLGLLAPIVVGLFEPERAETIGAALRDDLVDLSPRMHRASESGLVERLRDELRSERVPIVSLADHHPDDGRARFAWLGEVVAALGTRKLVVLRSRGGIGPQHTGPLDLGAGHLLTTHEGGISVINLTSDFDALIDKGLLQAPHEVELLERLRELLWRPRCSGVVASVTSPLNLLRELFTVRGAGTFVKRGARILRSETFEEIDTARLSALLESSFGRRLEPAFFESRPLAIYLEESYRGAAVLVPSTIAPFLTKFAVDRVARGEGVGRDLWQAIIRDHPALFWRARADNPIASWYTKICDGMARTGRYTVYWRGIATERIADVIADATSRPDDFGPAKGG